MFTMVILIKTINNLIYNILVGFGVYAPLFSVVRSNVGTDIGISSCDLTNTMGEVTTLKRHHNVSYSYAHAWSQNV